MAETLNELNGPSQKVIDLINRIRERVKITRLLFGDFDKESFRNQIFKERDWEFYGEAKRREDQIRQGTFISGAQASGKNAKED